MTFFSDLLTNFFFGILSSLNPCVLPLFPGFISYLSHQQKNFSQKNFMRFTGIIVLAGVLFFMTIIAFIVSLLSLSLTTVIGIISPIAFIVLVILGFLMIFNVNFFSKIPKPKNKNFNNPYLNAFSFGLFYGPIVIPCGAPLFLAAFTFSTTVLDFSTSFLSIMSFGLGLGLPLLVVSFLPTNLGIKLTRFFAKNQKVINRIVGTCLIILGLYELIFVFRLLDNTFLFSLVNYLDPFVSSVFSVLNF